MDNASKKKSCLSSGWVATTLNFLLGLDVVLNRVTGQPKKKK